MGAPPDVVGVEDIVTGRLAVRAEDADGVLQGQIGGKFRFGKGFFPREGGAVLQYIVPDRRQSGEVGGGIRAEGNVHENLSPERV